MIGEFFEMHIGKRHISCTFSLTAKAGMVYSFLFTLLLLSGCVAVRPDTPQKSVGWTGIDANTKGSFVPGADLDGDTVTDDRERALGSNPENRDTDDDSFADGLEDRLSDFGFDVVVPNEDTDRDGLPDVREAVLGTEPNRPDSDGDGWGDFDEQLNRYFGFDPTVPTLDTDFDGLSDDLERELGSSPTQVDSNNDGINDFLAYSSGNSPVGPPLRNVRGELIGISYSTAMGDALERIREGGKFPAELAQELPYSEVTGPVIRDAIRPSAALMQRSLYNPRNSLGVYQTYAEIERDLANLAATYDGSNGPLIVRLFHWTGQTQDNCDRNRESRPGRKIYAVKVSADPHKNSSEPEVAFFGVHHARELITAVQTMNLLRTLTDGYLTDDRIRKLVDTREVWVIPVVNPNGYERAISAKIDWRKNTRLVHSQDLGRCGIDLNRNYDFEHVTVFPPAQRASLPDVSFSGVNQGSGNLEPDSDTYPGPAPFSEVETQAVRGLAHSHFLTKLREEVDGLACSLSWHSFGGVVGHPMSHTAIPPDTGLHPSDIVPLGDLTDEMANSAGYKNVKDGFGSLTSVDGCPYPGYQVYGDTNDWLYKDGHTFSVLIESYSMNERGGCATGTTPYNFYPLDAVRRDLVAKANVEAALKMIEICPIDR